MNRDARTNDMDGAWQDRVHAIFQRVTDIPPTEWEYARGFLTPRSYAKSEHLLQAGEVAEHSFLLLQGLVRVYYLTGAGKEFISGFVAEDQFCGSVTSIIGGRPSRFFIQALEDVDVVLLPRAAILRLYDRHPCWERFGRIIAEGVMMFHEVKEGEILDSLETRYLRLRNDHPRLHERVPQYHLASYLGITNVALSRLRGRLKAKGLLDE